MGFLRNAKAKLDVVTARAPGRHSSQREKRDSQVSVPSHQLPLPSRMPSASIVELFGSMALVMNMMTSNESVALCLDRRPRLWSRPAQPSTR